MSHLIPEVRVNKNGVPVTKYVRPDSGTPAGPELPVPALKAAPAAEVTAEEVADLFNDMETAMIVSKRGLEWMRGYRPETLRKAKTFLQEWPKEDEDTLAELFGMNLKYEALFDVAITVARDIRRMVPPGDYINAVLKVTTICNEQGITQMNTPPNDFHYGLVKAEVMAQSVNVDATYRTLIPHQRAMFVERVRENLEALEPAAPVIAAIGALHGLDGDGPSVEDMLGQRLSLPATQSG